MFVREWKIFNWREYVQKCDKEIKDKKFDISTDARENKKKEEDNNVSKKNNSAHKGPQNK